MVPELSLASSFNDDDDDDDTAADDSASLDTLIVAFRASAHRVGDSRTLSPSPRSRHPKPTAARGGGRSLPARVPPKAVPRRRQASDDSDREEEEAIWPMPKLTQLPRPKPSLLQLPRSKLLEIPKPAAPKRQVRAPVSPPRTRLQSTKAATAAVESSVASSQLSTPSPLSSPSSPRAKKSTTSSALDSPSSIDSDIHELSRLISSAHDAARNSSGATAALAQRTRFRTGTFAFESKATAAAAAKSSAAQRSPAVPFSKLQLPTRSRRLQLDIDDEAPPPPPPLDGSNEVEAIDTEDSFAEEIQRLRRAARKQREKAALDEQKKKAAPSPEAKEISEQTTANIRKASHAIDAALLLALQPLERRRKELENEEAAAAAAAASEAPAEPAVPSTLPLATQAIVEQLDLTFASMTEQRNAELKAAEDAAGAAKAAEEAAKAAAEAKAQVDERAEKQREAEILRLLPMRGKLLATSADVDDALRRLELAENEAARTLHGVAGGAGGGDDAAPPPHVSLVDELARLQQMTMQRMQAIEQSLVQQQQQPDEQESQGLERGDWTRCAVQEQQAPSTDEATDTVTGDYSDSRESGSLHDILQQQVVEKLDLTILRLRHVLNIDEKEAEEAKSARAREQQAQLARKLQEENEAARRKQEQEDADAARRRVMGLSSLEQVRAWVDGDTDADEQLQASLANARALDRLATALDLRVADSQLAAPSCFDTQAAIARFDAMTELASAHTPDTPRESPDASRNQRQHEWDDSSSSDDDDGAASVDTRRRLRRVRFEPQDGADSSDSRPMRSRRLERVSESKAPASQKPARRLSPALSRRRDELEPPSRRTRAANSKSGSVVARVQQELAQLQAERRQRTSAWRAIRS